MRGLKQRNEYDRALEPGVYDAAPKSVLAAIAISRLTLGGDRLDLATRALVTEWDTLHSNGVVPQPVPPSLRRFIGIEYEDGLAPGSEAPQ